MPKQRGGVATVLVSLSMLGMLTACGSDTSPEDWAGRVCGALAPWRTGIAQLAANAQREVSTASTPAQAQAGLVELLAGGEKASETARAAVVSAGTPDVDGGAEIAGQFAASLTRARDAYAHAKTDLQALPTGDAPAFYDRVVAVLAALNTEYEASSVDTAALDSVELRNAFDKVDRCQ